MNTEMWILSIHPSAAAALITTTFKGGWTHVEDISTLSHTLVDSLAFKDENQVGRST